MIIIHQAPAAPGSAEAGRIVVTGIGETPRPAEIKHHPAEIVHHDADIARHEAVFDIANGIATPAWDEVIAEAYDETVAEAWDETVTPAETDAEFEARMVSAVVPLLADGVTPAPHVVVPASALPTDAPPERWSVDWQTGAITVLPLAPQVPQSVTNYQARAALLRAGLFGQVDAAVKAQGADSEAYQAWEYANNVYRDSPLIAGLGAALGLTAQQIDGLFVVAAGIDS